MRYPDKLIKAFHGASGFASAASSHPYAPEKSDGTPRKLDASAVYMWKSRDTVPFMWRPVVADMMAKSERGAA